MSLSRGKGGQDAAICAGMVGGRERSFHAVGKRVGRLVRLSGHGDRPLRPLGTSLLEEWLRGRPSVREPDSPSISPTRGLELFRPARRRLACQGPSPDRGRSTPRSSPARGAIASTRRRRRGSAAAIGCHWPRDRALRPQACGCHHPGGRKTARDRLPDRGASPREPLRKGASPLLRRSRRKSRAGCASDMGRASH